MRNFYKPIQDKKVVVVVDGKSVTFTNEKGQAVKFLASGEDFSIKYNTGALGGEYCVVDDGVCAYTEPNPKDFVNGNTYTAYYIAYFTERKCRRVNGTSDYYDEMYVELKTDDGYYSGKCAVFRITYILDNPQFCKEGKVILGLARCIIQ